MVPAADLEKPPEKVFYLPMHSVRKESSTTTKVRAAFDGSAKSSTGVSLNDTLMVGSTIHPSLVDVLLWFRMHRIALVADISCMYHAVMLNDSDRDYHRFVWQNHPSDPIRDYRMTRVPFGVAASSFAANTSVKQNAVNSLLYFLMLLLWLINPFMWTTVCVELTPLKKLPVCSQSFKTCLREEDSCLENGTPTALLS